MVTRRQVTIAFGAGALGARFHADAQSPQKVHRVGFLSAGGQTPDGAPPASLRDALRALGYVDGRNVVYESRFASGMVERLPDLAADLVRLKVDVIVTQGGSATRAAKGATSTIAIVMAPAAGDAVATGLIASLARPGGNITGMTDESLQLSAKRMQLLHEVVPKATLFAILWIYSSKPRPRGAVSGLSDSSLSDCALQERTLRFQADLRQSCDALRAMRQSQLPNDASPRKLGRARQARTSVSWARSSASAARSVADATVRHTRAR